MSKIKLVLDLQSSTILPKETQIINDQNIKFFTLSETINNQDTQRKLYNLVREGVLDDPSVTGNFETFDQFVQKIFVPCYWNYAETQFLASINEDWIGLSSI